MEIYICPDLEALSHKAAAIFLDITRNCIVSKGGFAVAIPGGFTPRRFYILLSSNQYREKVDWHYVHFF
jgi:6-phosphogluconolactonase/glucosamine-6-phosphate isomerase/deaminase